MTVKELIAMLKQMPQSLQVVIGDGSTVSIVSLDRYENLCNCDDREGFDGTDQMEPSNDQRRIGRSMDKEGGGDDGVMAVSAPVSKDGDVTVAEKTGGRG
jgi:hypothetical protein